VERAASELLGRLADRVLESLAPEDLVDERVPEKVGRYEVLRPLGRGAEGRVFLAWDPSLGRTVALKVLARSRDAERFQREMQVLGRLDHPGIVRVHDAGVSDEGPFFVMELVEGPTLAESSLPLEDGVRVLEQVARACHAAHARGIVHRDLKPSNIVLGTRPVVLDFGVACVLAEGARERRVGTPEYMAPEQVTGGEVGPWTDVHALGVILYELLAGRTPFEGPDVASILDRVIGSDVEPPSRAARGIPRALEKTALRALAPRPSDRHASADELANELRRWLDRHERRRRGLVVAALVGAAALLLLFLVRRPPPPPPPEVLERHEAPPPRREDRRPPPPRDRPPPPREDDRPPPPREDDRPPPPREDERPPPPFDEDGPPPRRPGDDRPPPPRREGPR
jgi:serine/threonine protein kinase